MVPALRGQGTWRVRAALLEDWSKGDANDKTLVFQSRMTWVCAQVAMRYPERKTEYLGYTRHGLDLLENVMWDKQEGGFFWGLDESGKIKASYGGEKHAYGIAFALYGLSAAYEATGERRALDLARRTFAWLDRQAHDAANGGYYEALSRSGAPIGSSARAVPAAAVPARRICWERFMDTSR